MSSGDDGTRSHPDEPHAPGVAQRMNWLRAGVLGANDGIVSVAAVVVGVAGATAARAPVLAAGAAALVGGALSMALGEYVSVSSQRDAEHALIDKERDELATMPEQELAELVELYEEQGLSPATARQVAVELTERDALRAHLRIELGINPDDVPSPWPAAGASALAFLTGGLLPFVVVLLAPTSWRVPATFVAVLAALVLTGWVGATVGGSSRRVAATRVVVGGALALAATFAAGSLLGATGAV